MVKQSSIKSSFTKVDKRSGNGTKLLVAGAVILTALFFVSMTGDEQDISKKRDSVAMESGQAHQTLRGSQDPPLERKNTTTSVSSHGTAESNENHPEWGGGGAGDASEPLEWGNGGYGKYTHHETHENNENDNMVSEEDLNHAVLEAVEKLQQEEKEDLKESEKAVTSTLTSVTNHIRLGIGKLFGSTPVNTEEMEAIVHEVEEKLQDEAIQELEERAEAVFDMQVTQLESGVDLADENGGDYAAIQYHVWKRERDAKQYVKNDIDYAAKDINNHLRTRAAEIEKEILEKRLSERLGKTVKLTIVDDEVRHVDELLYGLNNLAPPQQQQQLPLPPQPQQQGYGGGYNYGAGYGQQQLAPPQQQQLPPPQGGFGGYNNGYQQPGYQAPPQQQQVVPQQGYGANSGYASRSDTSSYGYGSSASYGGSGSTSSGSGATSGSSSYGNTPSRSSYSSSHNNNNNNNGGTTTTGRSSYTGSSSGGSSGYGSSHSEATNEADENVKDETIEVDADEDFDEDE